VKALFLARRSRAKIDGATFLLAAAHYFQRVKLCREVPVLFIAQIHWRNAQASLTIFRLASRPRPRF